MSPMNADWDSPPQPAPVNSNRKPCPRCGLLVTVAGAGQLLQHNCHHGKFCSIFEKPPCEQCKTDRAPQGKHALPPGESWSHPHDATPAPTFGGAQSHPERPQAPKPQPVRETAAKAPPRPVQASLFGAPEPPPPDPAPTPKGKAKPDLPRKARHAAGSDTSHAAAASLSEAVLGDLQLKVLEAIIACKDMTCDEVETHLDLSHQTASARINELRGAGYIEDSGQRRKTKHGRAAAVYVPTRKASE